MPGEELVETITDLDDFELVKVATFELTQTRSVNRRVVKGSCTSFLFTEMVTDCLVRDDTSKVQVILMVVLERALVIENSVIG